MISFKEYLAEANLKSSDQDIKESVDLKDEDWDVKYQGTVDGKDLGMGGPVDVYKGHKASYTGNTPRWYIRAHRANILRKVPSDHKAVRRHLFPGKV